MVKQNGETADNWLEDISDCQADNVGIEGFGECRRNGPNACPYALPFGYAFLCRHPRLDEIVQTTTRPREATAGTG